MLFFIALSAIESIFNHALRNDSDARKKIASIKNQVIKINCNDWDVVFFIVPDENGLQFHTKYFRAENTLITGTLNNFLNIFIKGADSKTLFQHPIDITGNTQTVEVLRDAFKNLDLDLEEKLSKIIGDVAAHKIFSHAKNTKKIAKNTSEKLNEQLKEYIYFEARNFPTKKEVGKFYVDVATLRDDVERLEAKIHHKTHLP